MGMDVTAFWKVPNSLCKRDGRGLPLPACPVFLGTGAKADMGTPKDEAPVG